MRLRKIIHHPPVGTPPAAQEGKKLSGVAANHTRGAAAVIKRSPTHPHLQDTRLLFFFYFGFSLVSRSLLMTTPFLNFIQDRRWGSLRSLRNSTYTSTSKVMRLWKKQRRKVTTVWGCKISKNNGGGGRGGDIIYLFCPSSSLALHAPPFINTYQPARRAELCARGGLYRIP